MRALVNPDVREIAWSLMSDPRTAATRLRDLRHDAGLTMRDAAQSLGLHASSIAQIEAGHRLPKLETVRAMLRLYSQPALATAVEVPKQTKQVSWTDVTSAVSAAVGLLIAAATFALEWVRGR
jgi:DNA-binding XRE family transcriptional regulator